MRDSLLHLTGNNISSATLAMGVELVAGYPQLAAAVVAEACDRLRSSISDSLGTGGIESLASVGGQQAVVMINGYHGAPFIILRTSHLPDMVGGRLIHVKLVEQGL